MDTISKQKLIVELSRNYVSTIAPEELPLFRAQSEAYLKDPQKTINDEKRRDEPLGFGDGGHVTFLTPVAIAVTTEVFNYLENELVGGFKYEGSVDDGNLKKPVFTKLHVQQESQKSTQGHNSQKAQQNSIKPANDQVFLNVIRKVATDKARQMNLSEVKANQLANSIVADLVLSG